MHEIKIIKIKNVCLSYLNFQKKYHFMHFERQDALQNV